LFEPLEQNQTHAMHCIKSLEQWLLGFFAWQEQVEERNCVKKNGEKDAYRHNTINLKRWPRREDAEQYLNLCQS
jgi:hypothetical protein